MPASSGLSVRVAPPPRMPERAASLVTEEAAISALPADDFRIDPLVGEGETVAQGAPVLRDRRHPELVTTAPMPGRVAAIELGPGHRLSSIRFFHEPGAGRQEYDVAAAAGERGPAALRALLQGSGLWQAFRSRPFGRVPPPTESPAAIFVMALDSRPLAPDPRLAVAGMEAHLERGLRALVRLTPGPMFLCQDRGADLVDAGARPDSLRILKANPLHPWGLAGPHVHSRFPAAVGRPVWDIHVEDVAAIGALLTEGTVTETRLVAVAGPALRSARLVRCQPGADLRGLCYGHEKPGTHLILSGSPLDGREGRWLRHRDRQVTALDAAARGRRGHWFLSALFRAARPMPLIPTAAVEQALGGVLPTMPFLRALSAGDDETFKRLDGLSLIAEDLALVDYVTNAEPPFAGQLDAMLDRIAAEEAP